MTFEMDKNGASVKFPPPIVFMLFMLVAYGVHSLVSIEISSMRYVSYLGSLFVISGLAVLLLASISFKRHQTSIKPWKPTTQIISSGLFSYSRNPIYLSFCIVTIGIGFIVNSLWVSLSFIPSITIIFFNVVKKEEHYLENKFGEDYLRYKAKVRRWL